MAKIIGICGVKNSGKTTLISKLVSHYASQGCKVAVIKHDGHDFECDIEGTDTRAFSDSGAYGVACFSENRMFVHRIGTAETEKQLIELFPEADIIFIEGLKNSAYNKIEVIRSGISDKAVSNPEGRFLIATDMAADTFCERTAGIDDIAQIAGIINEVLWKTDSEEK